MRQTQIFAGSSHPALVDSICERLGLSPANAELGKFSNGETKVNLYTSIRDQNVFIIQSGSNKINDNVMELLIMISACKSGSARSITAVMPYFPYSRQSKKKSHRGSITARMLANLLHVAGVNHVITIDLHASQMQGFFHCPVDNLVAEPLIAHWIKYNIPDWKRAVVVSKNPGGTKRVTSLADALKLNFGIIMTDRPRPSSGHASMNASTILERPSTNGMNGDFAGALDSYPERTNGSHPSAEDDPSRAHLHTPQRRRMINSSYRTPMSPLQQSVISENPRPPLSRAQTTPSTSRDQSDGAVDDDDMDSHSHDVVTGRLIYGHIVEDDAPSPSPSTLSGVNAIGHHNAAADPNNSTDDHAFASSFYSTTSAQNLRPMAPSEALGGSGDAIASSDDEEENLKNPELESTVTLVGNVRDRPVLIVDDMIDKSASWIAAAETVMIRGGATGVWCMATHGIFDGGRSLREMEECEWIEGIVVTNAFPIPGIHNFGSVAQSGKLTVLDVSHLLAEAIRRNRHGESISQLFSHHD